MSLADLVAHGSVLRLAAPLVVSFWMRAAVTFVDTLYAAAVGDAAVAAVGLTIPLEFLMIAVWVGLSNGLTSQLSRAIGAGARGRVRQYRRATARLVLVLVPVFVGVGIGIWAIAPRLDLDRDVASAFRVYGSVLVAGSAVTMFWSVLPDSIIKAHHDTRSTMWAGIWTNVLNLILNTWFVFGLGWGVFGIALSTVVGRLGGLIYALHRAGALERGRCGDDRPVAADLDPAPTRAILALAVPSAATFGLMATESAVVNALLTRTPFPTESVAAYSIFYRTSMFCLQPVIATSVALLPFVARLEGTADIGGARRAVRQVTLAAALYATALALPAIWIAPWIARRLSESETTASYVAETLLALPILCLVSAPFLLCRPVFEGLGRGQPGLWMAIMRYAVLTGPLAWIGARFAESLGRPPLHGVIVGTLIAAAASSAVFLVWTDRTLRVKTPPGAGGRPTEMNSAPDSFSVSPS